ncbi:outer membrane protein assembly factor BamD [Bacteroidaceae bacterium]|uniref:outer membrane protein assembly factor BamD n=1 Tax=Prevotella sp. MGM2 TaxID=2033406 RepID=UPI000CEA5BA5|nr:outer membrane protein assembly factor BamD [Prevotella sp. MGM2]GAY29772.1 outer membrane assembly lipoprotein YfiO [Prevotella sp. MGM2]GFI34219.1 outer membrane protein assembly factor BamD [Bacteroidaceae bacterium]
MKHYLHIILSFTVFLFLISCGNYNKLQKTNNYDYKYEAAKQYYFEGQYNRASLFLQDVIATFKGTNKGEESLFLSGMSSYKARNYNAAMSFFRKYYQSYPRGLYTEKAHFYCGMSLYKNIPEVKLDQSATYEAISEFQEFLELYPGSVLSAEVQEIIFKLQDRLVEKEYLSAKLYYDLGSYFLNCSNGGSNYQACIVTAENAIKDFPYTSRREDFAILILRAKFELAAQSIESKKEERYHNAIDEYYGFTNEYPESKYMKEANELFKKAKQYTSSSDSED